MDSCHCFCHFGTVALASFGERSAYSYYRPEVRKAFYSTSVTVRRISALVKNVITQNCSSPVWLHSLNCRTLRRRRPLKLVRFSNTKIFFVYTRTGACYLQYLNTLRKIRDTLRSGKADGHQSSSIIQCIGIVRILHA